MTLTDALVSGLEGSDTLVSIDEVSLQSGGGAEVLDASGFTASSVTLDAQGGDDTLRSPTQAFGTVLGGPGTDRLVVSGDLSFDLGDTLLAFGAGPENTSLTAIERASITGGAGANDLNAADWTGGAVTLSALAGNDTLVGSPAADSLDAGADLDRLTSAANTNQTLTNTQIAVGGAGTDTIAGFDEALLTDGAGSNRLDASGWSGPSSLVGNSGDNTLLGGSGSDSLFGDAVGTDRVIQTSNANQTLTNTSLSGQGADTLAFIDQVSLTGGAGGNEINAGSFTGSLTVSGLAGADSITGGSGADSLAGGTENDVITGNDGADQISGDADNDSLDGGANADVVDGGGGNDTIDAAGGGDDSLIGGSGSADRVVQSENSTQIISDTLLTGLSTDTLATFEQASLQSGATNALLDAGDWSGSGVTLDGFAGTNTLVGSAGNDVLFGGAGAVDRVDQTLDGTMSLDDTLLTGVGNDTLSGIERASLTGGAAGNLIDAGSFAGRDVTLDGLGGNDTLVASTGSEHDSLDAGAGTSDRVVKVSDTPLLKLTNTLVTENMAIGDTLAGFEQASLVGGGSGNGIDATGFTAGATTLAGLGGNDTLFGSPQNDALDAGAGSGDLIDRTISGGSLTMTDAQISVSGLDTDTLTGFENASIGGSGGPDSIDLSGFSGPTTISANSGDDTLSGGGSADFLLGGGGVGDRVDETSDDDITLAGDSLTVGAEGTDTLSGVESASLAGGSSANVIDAANATVGFPVAIDGLAGADSLLGSFTSGTLLGGAGNDTLAPKGGNDSIAGGSEADRLIATTFGDLVLTDTQLTGAGTDSLSGIEQASLTGDGSQNQLDAGAFSGTVTLSGGTNTDTLVGAAGSDMLDGGSDTNDFIRQTANADQQLTDTEVSGDGTDTLVGVERASLTGGAAGNQLDASAFTGGPVTLAGLAGADTLSPGGGAFPDRIEGGADSDRLVSTSDAANRSLTDVLLTGQGSDTLADVEAASLTGGGSANDIDASGFTGGPVSIAGLGGADSIDGSPQADLIDGGISNDLLSSGSGGDEVLGGDGLDSIDGGNDADLIDGGPGADSLDGASGTDTLRAASDGAALTLTDASLNDGAANDTLAGLEAASLSGGAAANAIDASAFGGAVSIDGLGGADSLTGSPQDDVLTGGGGSDTLSGLAGDDVHNTTDGVVDENLCGPGADTLNADDIDTTTNCETIFASDTTPPETTITSGPANGSTITTSSATFGFSSSEAGSTFTCALDGGAAEACNSGTKTYTGLADGAHSFAVFATDNAGNADASAATRSFSVAVPPPTTPTQPPTPTPPTGPTLDRVAPRLELTGAKKQKSKSKIVVKATCANEACDLKATGEIKVKVLKGKKVKKTKTLKLKAAKASAKAGESAKLKLKLNGKAKKLVKKVLKKKASKATVTVEATDAAGNSSSAERKIKVIKKKKKKGK